MNHADLVKAVYAALEKLLEDAEVPQSQTKAELNDIADEVTSMLESLDGDDD